jgi:NAD(P)-dependent dehydrogenase (short-subunit alcohol dehydrogenase family)
MGGTTSSFTLDTIPSAEGKVIIVTGGSAGIGFATAQILAKQGTFAKLIIASRDIVKVEESVTLLKAEATGTAGVDKITGLALDLASFESIRAFVAQVASMVDRVDLLFDNAGVFIPPFGKTKEGFEVTIGTNGIGTAYVTSLLLPLIRNSQAARIIVVSSGAIGFLSATAFETQLADIGGEKRTTTDMEAYGFSKALNTMYASELQRRLNDDKIIVASVEPGFVHTQIQTKTDKSHFLTILTGFLSPLVAKSAKDGALPLL